MRYLLSSISFDLQELLGGRDQLIVAAVVVIALTAGLLLLTSLRRRALRRRPARLNPRLVKYGDPQAFAAARAQEAAKIVTTSSGGQIVGFRVIHQIETVQVDGLRRLDEAFEALKAAAALKGANAVINVYTDRAADGKCLARGDAVVVEQKEDDEV